MLLYIFLPFNGKKVLQTHFLKRVFIVPCGRLVVCPWRTLPSLYSSRVRLLQPRDLGRDKGKWFKKIYRQSF